MRDVLEILCPAYPNFLAMVGSETKTAIDEVVQGLPELLRADLLSKDPATRRGAEEIVAAKILAALQGSGGG